MTGPAALWISEPHGRELRARCTRSGRAFIAAALVLGALLVAVGLALRTPGNPLDAAAWVFGAVSAFPLVLAGVVLVNARAHVRGGYLDRAGARKVRRGLAVQWVCALLSAGVAGGARLSAPRPAPAYQSTSLTPAEWVYLLLLTALIALCGTAFAAGRALFPPTGPTG